MPIRERPIPEAYHGRGSIRAEVLSAGIISIGDHIEVDGSPCGMTAPGHEENNSK